MEQGLLFPDFSSWKVKSIRTGSNIVVAPENFYLADSRYCRKEYFTWDEALRLEKEVLLLQGWRLPTRKEWQQIVQEYQTLENLCFTLHLELTGYIWKEEIDKYAKNPSSVAPVDRGSNGYYWSSTKGNDGLIYSLSLGASGVYPSYGNDKDYGFAVRCVQS